MSFRLVVGGAVALLAACHDDSCLRGTCTTPCAAVVNTCASGELYVGPVGGRPGALVAGAGAADDVLLTNGLVTAVISQLDAPTDLAPTGGNLIDFAVGGGRDDMTISYQLAGILPDDAFAYRTLETKETAEYVSVTLRGTLDGRPEVEVVTHYELHRCDHGLRVRSELWNGSPETHAFLIADTMHWGKRRIVPFVPVAGQGYAQPELDLLELTALWKPQDLAAGATPDPESPAYASLACDRDALHGVNDLEISALGSPIELVEPGETLALERMLFVRGEGDGPAPAIDEARLARAQLFATPLVTVRGQVVANGQPFGSNARQASIVILVDGVPVTALAGGTIDARVPRGAVTVEVWSFGRLVATREIDGDTGDGDVTVGDIAIDPPGVADLVVTVGGVVTDALVVFHPADDATRAAVTGSFHGRLGECAPWLGPPNGASPACNQVLVGDLGGTRVDVPAGRYHVYASKGPAHTLARAEVEIVAGEMARIELALQPLELVPPGWLSADLHVHGRASFDSGFPDEDRVRSFAAAGVDVIAATDHDMIGDYTDVVRRLGLEDRVAVMGGLEATQIIPWLEVPGEDLPRVIGHFNFWPLRRVPSEPRAGAPSDEYLEPGELFDRMAPLVGAGGVMMMNHPWDEPTFGRDLGYLRAIKFDPRQPLDVGQNRILAERPAGGHANADWNAIEILNGADHVELQKARTVWHALLAQGLVAAGTGNSDSHGMLDAQLGWARNWVQAPTTVSAFDADVFDAAVRDGRLVAGNGVLITVEVGPAQGPRRGLSLAPYAAAAGDVVAITVRAPPWIPVDEVRVVTSRGTQVIATGDALAHPSDPFGTAGVVRYTATLPLAELVDGDDFLIVEAGLPYPDAADLDDDGVVDTTDNNGDGVVDLRDVEPDEDAGPMLVPPDPRDPSDRRYWVTRVVPGAWPMGFTNPILVDTDGNGWTPPGLR